MKSVFFLCSAEHIGDSYWEPHADVYQTRSGWIIKLDLAGVRKEDIEIVAEDQRVTVRGIRRDLFREENTDYYSLEISYNRFKRSIVLPFDLEHCEIATDYSDGMLIIRIKMEDSKQ